MSAPGRNDPCPCGSGKKYKKCCIPQFDKPAAPAHKDGGAEYDGAMTPDDWNDVPEEEIVAMLRSFGVETGRKAFVAELRETLDPLKVKERWEAGMSAEQRRRSGDFPYCAAVQLSRRWAPNLNSIDKLEDLIGETEAVGNEEALGRLRTVWRSLKELYISPHGFRSFRELEDTFGTYYDLETALFDYADGLWNAGLKQEGNKRTELLQERLQLCDEVVRLLPDAESVNHPEWCRLSAQTLEGLGRYGEAEAAYQSLVKEYPSWVWGYVGLGGLYANREDGRDPAKARDIYALGLKHCPGEAEYLRARMNALV